MSIEGIKIVANVFSLMQTTRGELLRMGTKNNDHQDIRLGQLLLTMKDAGKVEFEKLTLMEAVQKEKI